MKSLFFYFCDSFENSCIIVKKFKYQGSDRESDIEMIST